VLSESWGRRDHEDAVVNEENPRLLLKMADGTLEAKTVKLGRRRTPKKPPTKSESEKEGKGKRDRDERYAVGSPSARLRRSVASVAVALWATPTGNRFHTEFIVAHRATATEDAYLAAFAATRRSARKVCTRARADSSSG